MTFDPSIETPIEHDVPWLALLASGVDGSAGGIARSVHDELQRLRAQKECCHEPVSGRSAMDA
jgi:hypothetical protein